ncbi:hypothetical protein CQW23_17715 [Capsicum baccatum]|uniref:Uncharacterized protein n=1 Tax=Capsicum baccatum TaxID=33114 RepID=A0A2G2WEZ4_CAPBA|nr:hypothetical protein CQW23_17715 [Capsicum baccatum]
MSFIASGDPCDDDFEDYDCENDENYYDEDCGENEDGGYYLEECEYGDSYAFNNKFENDDASRYEFFTYSSCDASNSEESDYGLDDDNEKTFGEYSCSSSYYDSNSKHENGYGSYVCFIGEGGGRSFINKLSYEENKMKSIPSLKIQELVDTYGNFNIEAVCPKLMAWAKRRMQRDSVAKSLPDQHKILEFVKVIS